MADGFITRYCHVMTTASAAPPRHPRLHVFRRPTTWAAIILLAGTSLAWAGNSIWKAVETWGTPTCSWPLQVRGDASPAQVGLVRCYLRALAQHDTSGLLAAADYIPPVQITSADLSHAADARAGLATATFTQNPNDTESASVAIYYANAAQDELVMTNMIAMGGPSGWRMNIGTEINPASGPTGQP